MKTHLTLLLAALSGFSVRPHSQEPTPTKPDGPPDVVGLLSRWRAEHGDACRVELDRRDGFVEFLFGGNASGALAPEHDAQWFAAARSFVAETAAMHGVELSTLVDDSLAFLPLGMIGSSDKWTVRFRQQVEGVPVVDG